MSITVRDCLKLPSLSDCKVIAGSEGLDKIVSSVSVVEFIDFNHSEESKIDDYNPNELVISSLYEYRDNSKEQCNALKHLYDTGVVALVLFYVGHIIKEVQPDVIRMANSLKMPLIAVDYNISKSTKYSDVISDVVELIASEKTNDRSLMSPIINHLMQIPDEKRTISNLLHVISDYYKCNLILKDNQGHLISAANKLEHFNLDDTKNKDLLNQHFVHKSIKDPLIIENNVYFINAIELQIEHEHTLFLTVITENSELSHYRLEEIKECVKLYSSLWRYSLNIYEYDAILPVILKESESTINTLLTISAISFQAISSMLIIESEFDNLPFIQRQLKNIFKSYSKFNISGVVGNRLVILTQLEANSDSDNILSQEIVDYINGYEGAILFESKMISDLHSLQNNYSTYCKTSILLKKLFRTRKTYNIYDVNYVEELATLMSSDNVRKKSIISNIKKIFDINAEFLDTLAVYILDCNGQLNLTAETSFIHRNTVSYRLNQIKKITGMDFLLLPTINEYALIAGTWRLYDADLRKLFV